MKFKIFLLALLAFESTLISAKFNINKILAKYESRESSLTNCGPDTDPLKITSLYLQPSTLSLPGTIIAKGSARLNTNITGPLSVSLKIIKIIGHFKLEVPCVDNFGSCKYEDLCSLIYPNNDGCPDFFKKNNIPCSCPFPKGDYTAEDLELYIDLPMKPPGGHYNIIADVNNQELGHVACVNLDVWIS